MDLKAAMDSAVWAERERCIKIVEEIPASTSLYENLETAKAVIAFKEYAIKMLRK